MKFKSKWLLLCLVAAILMSEIAEAQKRKNKRRRKPQQQQNSGPTTPQFCPRLTSKNFNHQGQEWANVVYKFPPNWPYKKKRNKIVPARMKNLKKGIIMKINCRGNGQKVVSPSDLTCQCINGVCDWSWKNQNRGWLNIKKIMPMCVTRTCSPTDTATNGWLSCSRNPLLGGYHTVGTQCDLKCEAGFDTKIGSDYKTCDCQTFYYANDDGHENRNHLNSDDFEFAHFWRILISMNFSIF